MHTRCTNELLKRNTAYEIVNNLERFEFLFIALKVVFLTIGVFSLATIIFCYVSICKIITHKSISRIKSNANHSNHNSNMSTINDYQNSSTWQPHQLKEDVCQKSLTMPSHHLNEEISNVDSTNEDSAYNTLNNDNKKIVINFQIKEDESPVFNRTARRRWSVDVNSSGSILKKSSTRRPIKMISSISNANQINTPQADSSTITNNNMIINFQIEDPCCNFRRYNSLKLNENSFKLNKEPLHENIDDQNEDASEKKSKQDDAENNSGIIGDPNSENTICLALLKNKKKLNLENSQVSFKQSSTSSFYPNSTASGKDFNNNTSSELNNSHSIKTNRSHVHSTALRKTFIIILVFFIFWLPFLSIQSFILIYDDRSFFIENLNLISIAIGFCHSSINPLVYCCTNVEILKAMKVQYNSLFLVNDRRNFAKSRDSIHTITKA